MVVSIEDRVGEIIIPLLDDLDVELIDLEYGGGRLLVTIDTEQGIDAKTLTLATRTVSRELDETDPIPGKYTLEVSSPGLERRLRTPAHYQSAVGGDITVKLFEPIDGNRRFQGRLASADETSFTLIDDEAKEHEIYYDLVTKARTVFEWGPTPKPGGAKSKTKKAGAS